MKILEKTINFLSLLFRKDEAIFTCIKKDIPLTKENINEVREILKQKNKLSIANTKSIYIRK